MKKSFCLFFYFVIIFSLCAQSSFLVPRDVYVGDTALFSYPAPEFLVILGEKSVFAQGPSLSEVGVVGEKASTAEVTVLSVTIERNKEGTPFVSIRFIPWITGSVQLPTIYYGGIESRPPSIFIASLISSNSAIQLQLPRSPLLVPGTTWLIYGIITAVVVVLAAVFLFIRSLKKLSFRGSDSQLKKRRNAFIQKSLRKLERSCVKMEYGLWYEIFSKSVRRYLALFCHCSESLLLCSTSSALVSLLKATLGEEDQKPFDPALSSFFFDVDAARFMNGYGDKRLQHCKDFRYIIDLLEGDAYVRL